jgi:hypothetical protein
LRIVVYIAFALCLRVHCVALLRVSALPRVRAFLCVAFTACALPTRPADSRTTPPLSTSHPLQLQLQPTQDGVLGLMGRGLSLKLLSNGVSSVLFSVLWKVLMEHYQRRFG